MKIWFDISNSPHINMFYDLIKDLESEGHEIIITSRPLANTIELLEQKKLKHTSIGKHYGKSFINKIIGFPIRVIQLIKYLKVRKPDIAISQSSFHSPITAKILGIPSIYTNDNEHALGNKPSFFFATQILIPENLSIKNISSIFLKKNKILKYPGIKEGMYLWKIGNKINNIRNNNVDSVNKIFIRPEPQTAQYYKGKINFLDDTIIALQDKYEIILLPRDEKQQKHYKNDIFKNIIVNEKAIDFEEIAKSCQLFIGAGGSMTRELAILGIPTISVYQDKLLEVDKYLISNNIMSYIPMLTANKVQNVILFHKQKKPSIELMTKGEQAYGIFKKEILKYNVS